MADTATRMVSTLISFKAGGARTHSDHLRVHVTAPSLARKATVARAPPQAPPQPPPQAPPRPPPRPPAERASVAAHVARVRGGPLYNLAARRGWEGPEDAPAHGTGGDASDTAAAAAPGAAPGARLARLTVCRDGAVGPLPGPPPTAPARESTAESPSREARGRSRVKPALLLSAAQPRDLSPHSRAAEALVAIAMSPRDDEPAFERASWFAPVEDRKSRTLSISRADAVDSEGTTGIRRNIISSATFLAPLGLGHYAERFNSAGCAALASLEGIGISELVSPARFGLARDEARVLHAHLVRAHLALPASRKALSASFFLTAPGAGLPGSLDGNLVVLPGEDVLSRSGRSEAEAEDEDEGASDAAGDADGESAGGRLSGVGESGEFFYPPFHLCESC